jgi:hypothetical protein
MAGKSMRPGGGGRFAKLKAELARRGVKNPAALAAWLGRQKYGKKRFQAWAAAGRRSRAAAQRRRRSAYTRRSAS